MQIHGATVTSTLPAELGLRHITLGTNSGSCITNSGTGAITIGDLIFAVCAQFHMSAAGPNANILTQGSYAISGSAQRHVNSQQGGHASIGGPWTITFLDDVNITTFVLTFLGGLVTANGLNFDLDGHTVTGKRYNIATNAVCYTGGGGENYFPGDTAGMLATGGLYN